MPWEDAEEKKRKQGGNNARFAYVLQVYQPDYNRISKLCHMAKQRKLWVNHWGNTTFTVKIPENDSQQGKKIRYIQMVQTNGSVQLSLRAATINGEIDADSNFMLQLTPGANGSPRVATQTSLREVFCMMEVKSRKVWICVAKGSSGKYTGYFSSVVKSINNHVRNFVACPGAQVYWWLRRRGCLAEDINWVVRHCFTLDQQQKITKSKYIPDKGYAVLDESNTYNIINAVAEEEIFDTTLGLLERERRSAITGKGHDASKIMGAVKAHNFSSSASITTIHLKNVNDSKSVTSQKMLAKSVFSMATSKITADGSEEEEADKDEGSDYDGSATEPSGVETEGMQMLTREQSMKESSIIGQEEESGENSQGYALEEEAQPTRNMNKATAQLTLLSVDGEQDMEEDEEEFDNAMNREVDSEEETSYAVHRSDNMK